MQTAILKYDRRFYDWESRGETWWFCGCGMAQHFLLDLKKRYRLHFTKRPHESGESVQLRMTISGHDATSDRAGMFVAGDIRTAWQKLGEPRILYATLEEL